MTALANALHLLAQENKSKVEKVFEEAFTIGSLNESTQEEIKFFLACGWDVSITKKGNRIILNLKN